MTAPVPAGWQLSAAQRATLAALVDTVVPAVVRADDPTGFWATPGTAVGAHLAVEQALATLDADGAAGAAQLLDTLGLLGFASKPLAVRETLTAVVGNVSADAFAGMQGLRGLCALLAYSLPDAAGTNPFWAGIGYPGPPVSPPRVAPLVTAQDGRPGQLLQADAVIVGSGAGGAVVAAELAAAGWSVVVLEAAGHQSESDYTGLEAVANATMMWRGGLATTTDNNVVLLAGATLGGGTVINWQNCVPTPAVVRAEWAAAGLDDVAGPEFDDHQSAVLDRLCATDTCSDYNGAHQRLAEGAKALGWSLHTALRNVDASRHDPELAGYSQFGDPTGAKVSALRAHLADAYAHGSTLITRAAVTRVLVDGGRASGVVAAVRAADGTPGELTVRARTVVLAAGALETPAVLLRSGVGGPAVGQHLRLHPSAGMFGVYDDEQRAWWGPPQAAIMDEFADFGDGHGFLVEGSQYYPGLFAYQLNVAKTGLASKAAVADLRHAADFLFVVRDHGAGAVTLGPDGAARHSYPLSHAEDRAVIRAGLVALARLHEAAGAQRIHTTAPGAANGWRRGEDLDTFLGHVTAAPLGAGGLVLGSAHQMGSARLGADPATSVGTPRGELHDTPGVWIADTSAFPTASGANPMLTAMTLARRTARHILAGASA